MPLDRLPHGLAHRLCGGLQGYPWVRWTHSQPDPAFAPDRTGHGPDSPYNHTTGLTRGNKPYYVVLHVRDEKGNTELEPLEKGPSSQRGGQMDDSAGGHRAAIVIVNRGTLTTP